MRSFGMLSEDCGISPSREHRFSAVEEHDQSYKAIEAEGCAINGLTPKEHEAFVAAVQPLLAEAHKTYGDAMFRMVPKA